MKTLATLILLLVATSAFAADPRPYHLELEANPGAPFPYLGRFGTVEIHVYRAGVRAEALWIDGFSRNGSPQVTVMNPLGRLYVDVPVSDIAPTLTKLSGGATPERNARPQISGTLKGKVSGIDATRYRLSYGPDAYVDYWTTTTIDANPQFRTIVDQLVRGISPGTADVARTISGTPLYVELNFRRFKKLPLLRVKSLKWEADDEQDALTRGPIYVRASVLEALWK